MPSTFTSSLRLVLPATGELSNTWGTVFNAGATNLIDTAISGTTSITMAAADYTLTSANGAADEARAMFLVLGGTPGAARNVIVPAVSKLYFVTNNTTGGFAQTVKTSAGSGISVPNGNSMVLRCNGTNVLEGITLPSAGVSLSADNTWTGTQTFSGTSAKFGVVLNDAAEVATVSATAATGTINYDITTQSVLFYTTNASGNFTVNLRASAGTTLNTALAVGQAATVVFLVTNGTTAYYNTTVQVDGATAGVTTRWQGGAAPTAGNASGVDVYSYTVIKTAAATFTVLAAQTRFA